MNMDREYYIPLAAQADASLKTCIAGLRLLTGKENWKREINNIEAKGAS